MIRRRIPRRMGKLRTEGNGMGKRRRRLISIPLLSSFSTSKGFRSSHGSDLEEEEEEEQRGTTLAFPTIFAIPTYKKRQKRRFIKASGPSSSFYLSHFLLLPLSPPRLWWPKVAKILHPTGGRAICGTKEEDSPNMKEKDRFFSAFSRDAVRDRRTSLLATNWPSREEALLLLLPFFRPGKHLLPFPLSSSLSSTHGRKERRGRPELRKNCPSREGDSAKWKEKLIRVIKRPIIWRSKFPSTDQTSENASNPIPCESLQKRTG